MIDDAYLNEKENQMRNCHHLFVVVQKENIPNNPLFVQCIYCGLTNKYLKKADKDLNNYERIHNSVFWDQYRYAYQEKEKKFDSNAFNCISQETLYSKHLRELYNLAREIKPDATNEEIFVIMKRLKEIETRDESIRTTLHRDDAIYLKSKYYKIEERKRK